MAGLHLVHESECGQIPVSFSVTVKGDGELAALVGFLFWFLLLELFCFL